MDRKDLSKRIFQELMKQTEDRGWNRSEFYLITIRPEFGFIKNKSTDKQIEALEELYLYFQKRLNEMMMTHKGETLSPILFGVFEQQTKARHTWSSLPHIHLACLIHLSSVHVFESLIHQDSRLFNDRFMKRMSLAHVIHAEQKERPDEALDYILKNYREEITKEMNPPYSTHISPAKSITNETKELFRMLKKKKSALLKARVDDDTRAYYEELANNQKTTISDLVRYQLSMPILSNENNNKNDNNRNLAQNT
jgi:hypothetical protein